MTVNLIIGMNKTYAIKVNGVNEFFPYCGMRHAGSVTSDTISGCVKLAQKLYPETDIFYEIN